MFPDWYIMVLTLCILGVCVDLILVGYVLGRLLKRIEKLEQEG